MSSSPFVRSSPPPVCRGGPTPSLGDLAGILHRSTAHIQAPVLVTIEQDRNTVSLGTWEVPGTVDHPADVLLGFIAPPSWSAFGLVTSGRIHRLDADAGFASAAKPESVRATVLLDRTGAAASIIEHAGFPLEVLPDPPEGWVADALARVLGRPTPPPAQSLAAWVEAAWLDQIATVVLARPGGVRSWPALARLHPLAPQGPTVAGIVLAAQSMALDCESHWGRIRRLWGASLANKSPVTPPGGTMVAPDTWFDDGSFARWSQRDLPPADALLPAILDALPDSLANELRDALTTVQADDRAA